ncbi:GNAT family N-acetyltransferase [Pseudothauera nasutitermitis]|uniref:GNAT family N-acetyltransferase n=1 Tax=Pseudothauera nasutitermitis TaxID=2565930 RepID=A0A4S4ARB5_9RHOO|nr:GNAT family N-acetyltransferase [Pseudothauera nasutitermitis]THF62353.1 GNAT family N-acetyltransferase [Pseudothauera nasutitermitis]
MSRSVLRPLRVTDLDAVLRVQASAYPPGYHEEAEVFATRLALAPGACWLGEQDGRAAAYVIAHPWADEQPPALHTPLGERPPGGDRVFLHDLAVSPDARGGGLARGLFGKVADWARAQGAREIMLVALADAHGFWLRQGFAADPAPLPAAYGAGACRMRLALAA